VLGFTPTLGQVRVATMTNKDGKLFFVYGSGGTGKTIVWTTLLSRLRGQGKIMLAIASS